MFDRWSTPLCRRRSNNLPRAGAALCFTATYGVDTSALVLFMFENYFLSI